MTKPYSPPPSPQGQVNVTDPDSKVVKGLRNWLQGYNAQAVTNEQHTVLAAEIETVGADFGHLEPMLDAAQHELKAAGVQETPEALLADAGYWHSEQMASVVDRGIVVLIPADTSRKRPTRRNSEVGHYAFMRRVPFHRARRSALSEAPTDDRVGLRASEVQPRLGPGQTPQLRRRPNRVAADHATHNLLKLHRHTLAAA